MSEKTKEQKEYLSLIRAIKRAALKIRGNYPKEWDQNFITIEG